MEPHLSGGESRAEDFDSELWNDEIALLIFFFLRLIAEFKGKTRI